MAASMDVAFGRQPLGRRRQLHVVGAARDDAIAGLHAALEADEVAVARGDLDEPAREASRRRSARTRTAGRPPSAPPSLRHHRHAHVFSRDRARPCRSVRPAAGRRGCRPRTAPVSARVSASMTPASCMWCSRSGIGSGVPGISSATLVTLADARDVGRRAPAPAARLRRSGRFGRAARLRRTTAPSVADHLGDAAGDRRAQDERIARRRRRRRCAASRRAAPAGPRAARSRASATVDRAPGVFDAARRHGPLGEQPLGPRLFGARRLDRGLRLGDLRRPASRDRRRPVSRGSSGPAPDPRARWRRSRSACRRQSVRRPARRRSPRRR